MRLERPAAQGRTVAHHEGLVLLVSRGAPGEDVEIEVERMEAQHALARVVTVFAAAPERVTPPCMHYAPQSSAACGGCDLQHLSYAAQLAAKRQAFLDQLARIGGWADPPLFEVVPSPEPLRTRDRLDFLLRAGNDGALQPVFHGAKGGDLVPINDCLLAPKELTTLAHRVGAALTTGRATADRVRVQAFAGDGPEPVLAITLYATSPAAARALAKRVDRWMPGLLTSQPKLRHVGVALAGKRESDDEALALATVLHGEPLLAKRVGAWRYPTPPEAFFQVHAAQAGRLVEHVVAEIGAKTSPSNGGSILDHFCGVGLFSLPLASDGYRVLGIELSDGAVRAARAAARDMPNQEAPSGVRRPEFKARNLDTKGALEDIAKSFGKPTAIVLDPPRRGLSAHLARGLSEVRASVIMYVSCDGGTFARDARRLAEHYTLERVRGFDLFPQTHHLEVVGTFVAR